MSVPNTKRTRTERSSNASVEAATHDKATDASEENGAAVSLNDRVIVLNVGGTKITTLQSTLCSTPSLLAEWADNNFREFPRDLQGHPFLDRDPDNFNHILNYLRGYGLPNRADDLVVVAEDAELYRLDALKREIGLNPPAMWRFTPGPGVREDGVEFSTADILDLCGTEPLSVGLVHTIVFRVDKCELVSIGVVAFKETQLDMQIRRQKNTVCYCNTGELVRCWSADALYEHGVLYKSQDEITVRVEFAQPGVPLGASERLPPPLQPAMSVGAESVQGASRASIATSTATAPSSATTNARATNAFETPTAAPSSATSTVTIHTASATNPLGASSALQPGSPVMDASANRLAQATPATAPQSVNTAIPAPAPPQQPPQPMSSPSLATAASAVGSTGAAPAVVGAPASPALPVAPVVLDPEDPDVPIGAVVTFFKGDREVCRARWPAPVPPLQFAVSMQGASGVSIVKASSVSVDAIGMENEEQ